MESLVSVDQLREHFLLREGGVLVRRTGCRMGRAVGFLNAYGYLRVSLHGKQFMAHRVVFALTYGRWPADEIDHRNGVRADNDPSNLREATSAENKHNSPVRRSNACGHKGVYFHKCSGRWMAQIRANGKRIFLGEFSDVAVAGEAYRIAAERLHGEFARA